MSGRGGGDLKITSQGDIVLARRRIREIAVDMGFGMTDVTRIVTAVSELTRNIQQYAGSGTMYWRQLEVDRRTGLELIFEDEGPGIDDLHRVLGEGYTTGGGLGMGLPGSRRLMDEMELESEPGRGTCVTVRKWLQKA